MNISKSHLRVPPLRGIFYGPLGSWKTSTLARIPRALWLDFHGSTSTLALQPDCAWDPKTMIGRPSNWGELLDTLLELPKYRADYDCIVVDGLDDIERQILIPEALRRSGQASLEEAYGKPGNMLLMLHKELQLAFEALHSAGFSLWFTCHDQKVESVNPLGANFLAIDLALYYVSGKVSKVNCPVVWRDWVDFCVYLTTEGRRVVKGEKDKVGKAVGDADQHVAYFRGEPWLDSVKGRRLDDLPSPMPIDSPSVLWRAIEGAWRKSFDAPALRADAMMLGSKKTGINMEKLRESVDAMNDPDELREVIQRLK